MAKPKRRQPTKGSGHTQHVSTRSQAGARGRIATQRASPQTRWSLIAVAIVGIVIIAGVGIFVSQRGNRSNTNPDAIGGITCRGLPAFAQRLGFGQQTQIDTSDTREPGVRLIEAGQGEPHVYRHPSWNQAGYLGAYAVDRDGTIYIAAAPQTSLFLNPPEQQNRVYRIDPQTGEMNLYIDLPAAQSPDGSNPYGVLGMALDCDTRSLYVTSVAGSTRNEEAGRVFRVDLQSAKVTATIEGIDAFGAGIFSGPDGRRLYLGYARQPDVAVVSLDDRGNFTGSLRRAFSVAEKLTDGDGRVRRITWSSEGMVLTITPFTYTLVPASTSQRLIYSYSTPADVWSFARSAGSATTGGAGGGQVTSP